MLRPSIFTDSLLDDVFGFPFYDDKADHRAERKLYGHHAANLMKTDIKEKNDSFELEIQRLWSRIPRRKKAGVISTENVILVLAREASILVRILRMSRSKLNSSMGS